MIAPIRNPSRMSFAYLRELFDKGEYYKVLEFANSQDLFLHNDPLAAQVVAAAFFQLGNYSKAADILDEHESVLGSDASFLSLYGATLRRLGKLNKARELFNRALALDPESPSVRNNYANLLIDLGEFPEAKSILELLLSANPSYQDAINNLTRLKACQKQTSETDDLEVSNSAQGDLPPWHLSDPLMLAFAEEEVQQAGAVNFSKTKSQSSSTLVSKLPQPENASIAEEQVNLATRSINEDNPLFALQLLSQAAKTLGAQQVIYSNVGDAYIRLKRFNEAEICFLHALHIGGPSFPVLLNLATLATMRSDVALARYYVDACSALDSAHPQLASIRDSILANKSMASGQVNFPPHWDRPELNVKK